MKAYARHLHARDRTNSRLVDVDRAIGAEIDALEIRLAQLRNDRRYVVGLMDSGVQSLDEVRNQTEWRGRVGRPASPPTKQIRNTAYDALVKSGGPLHARDILAAVRATGVEVVGKDPLNNMRSHLSHDIRFFSTGGGRWDLVRRPAVSTPDQGSGADRE